MIGGDRLTGMIIQVDQDTVLLKTTYAGIITIAPSQVQSLRRESIPANMNTVELPDIDPSVADGSEPDETQRTAAHTADELSLPEPAESSKTSAFTPGSELRGRVNFALSSESGNTDKNEVDFDYEVGYCRGWHRLESIGAIEVDTNDGDEITNKWSTRNRYSRHFPSHWYGAFWLALKHDRFADLRLRTLGGPVLGHLAFESEALNLSLEAGPLVLWDDFYDQPDQDLLGLGWFLNYDQLIWQDRLQPYHRQRGRRRQRQAPVAIVDGSAGALGWRVHRRH